MARPSGSLDDNETPEQRLQREYSERQGTDQGEWVRVGLDSVEEVYDQGKLVLKGYLDTNKISTRILSDSVTELGIRRGSQYNVLKLDKEGILMKFAYFSDIGIQVLENGVFVPVKTSQTSLNLVGAQLTSQKGIYKDNGNTLWTGTMISDDVVKLICHRNIGDTSALVNRTNKTFTFSPSNNIYNYTVSGDDVTISKPNKYLTDVFKYVEGDANLINNGPVLPPPADPPIIRLDPIFAVDGDFIRLAPLLALADYEVTGFDGVKYILGKAGEPMVSGGVMDGWTKKENLFGTMTIECYYRGNAPAKYKNASIVFTTNNKEMKIRLHNTANNVAEEFNISAAAIRYDGTQKNETKVYVDDVVYNKRLYTEAILENQKDYLLRLDRLMSPKKAVDFFSITEAALVNKAYHDPRYERIDPKDRISDKEKDKEKDKENNNSNPSNNSRPGYSNNLMEYLTKLKPSLESRTVLKQQDTFFGKADIAPPDTSILHKPAPQTYIQKYGLVTIGAVVAGFGLAYYGKNRVDFIPDDYDRDNIQSREQIRTMTKESLLHEQSSMDAYRQGGLGMEVAQSSRIATNDAIKVLENEMVPPIEPINSSIELHVNDYGIRTLEPVILSNTSAASDYNKPVTTTDLPPNTTRDRVLDKVEPKNIMDTTRDRVLDKMSLAIADSADAHLRKQFMPTDTLKLKRDEVEIEELDNKKKERELRMIDRDRKLTQDEEDRLMKLEDRATAIEDRKNKLILEEAHAKQVFERDEQERLRKLEKHAESQLLRERELAIKEERLKQAQAKQPREQDAEQDEQDAERARELEQEYE